MKTYYFSTKNAILKSVVGLLGLTAISCGSYQNASYYDNDGIYGSDKREVVSTNETNSREIASEDPSANKYKEYFGSNADKYTNENDQTFTDIDNYSSNRDTTVVVEKQRYAGWGNNDRDVTINVYDNGWGYNNWNWHNYWGYRPWRSAFYCGYSYWNDWHNPYWAYSGFYGSSWGWGWNNPYYYGGYYGNYYGYNNYYGNGYYGRDYAYASGRRGTARTTSNSNYYDTNRINNSPRTFGTGGRRNNTATQPNRDYSPSNNTSSEPRTTYPRRRGTQYNAPIPRTSEPTRNEPTRVEPRRSEPRSYESPRSSSYESPRSYNSSPRSSSSSSSSSGGGRTGGRRG